MTWFYFVQTESGDPTRFDRKALEKHVQNGPAAGVLSLFYARSPSPFVFLDRITEKGACAGSGMNNFFVFAFRKERLDGDPGEILGHTDKQNVSVQNLTGRQAQRLKPALDLEASCYLTSLAQLLENSETTQATGIAKKSRGLLSSFFEGRQAVEKTVYEWIHDTLPGIKAQAARMLKHSGGVVGVDRRRPAPAANGEDTLTKMSAGQGAASGTVETWLAWLPCGTAVNVASLTDAKIEEMVTLARNNHQSCLVAGPYPRCGQWGRKMKADIGRAYASHKSPYSLVPVVLAYAIKKTNGLAGGKAVFLNKESCAVTRALLEDMPTTACGRQGSLYSGTQGYKDYLDRLAGPYLNENRRDHTLFFLDYKSGGSMGTGESYNPGLLRALFSLSETAVRINPRFAGKTSTVVLPNGAAVMAYLAAEHKQNHAQIASLRKVPLIFTAAGEDVSMRVSMANAAAVMLAGKACDWSPRLKQAAVFAYMSDQPMNKKHTAFIHAAFGLTGRDRAFFDQVMGRGWAHTLKGLKGLNGPG